MKKCIILASALLGIAASASAQDSPQAYMQVDLTSAYLWRGQKNAGVSIQPVGGVKWKGFDLYAWGNTQVSPPDGPIDKHEIDLFLKYSVTPGFKLGFKNVYLNTRGDGFLSFGKIGHAANGLDALASLDLGCVNFEWTTTIAGHDGYNHDGKRAFGSYLLLGAPFEFGGLDWNAQVGIVPYYCSRYSEDVADGFHVNMCALKASHSFKYLNGKGVITPYSQLMVNPSSRRAFYQVGVRLNYNPSR